LAPGKILIFAACILAAFSASCASAQSLPDMLDYVYNNDPRIRAQEERLAIIDEGRAQAKAESLPQVNFTAGLEENRIDNSSLFDASGGVREQAFDFQTRGVGLTGSLEVFSGFRNLNNRRRAASLSEASQAELNLVTQTVLRDAAAAYFDLLRDRKVHHVRLENVEVLMLENRRAEEERELGVATLTDVAQTQSRLARAQSLLAQAKANLESSRAEYVKQVGKPPEVIAPLDAPIAIPDRLEDVLSIAREVEPRIVMARHREKAARYRVRMAYAAFSPTIDLGVSYQLADNPSFFVQDSDSLIYGARLSVPVLTGGLNRSKLREAKATLRAARQEVLFEERRVESDIAKAWARVAAARVSRDSAEKELQAAQTALVGVREEHALGLRTTLDILNAEQEKLNAEAFLAENERESNVAAFSLLAYIGALLPSTMEGRPSYTGFAGVEEH